MLLKSKEGLTIYKELIKRSNLEAFEKQVANNTEFLNLDNIELGEKVHLDSLIEKILLQNLNSQFADVLGYKTEYSKRRLIRMILEEPRVTSSDSGSLKIGSGDMSILIPNGRGDGEMKYYITDKVMHIGNFFTSVEGKINIYEHDCGDNVIETIEGRYAIYNCEGIVVFSKRD